MMNPALEKELRTYLDRLEAAQQQRVLDFARALASKKVPSVSGKALVRFAGVIEPDDLAIIGKAVEGGCEQVHSDEW